MGQLCYVCKTKSSCTAFDGVCAPKDTVELFIVGVRQIKIQKHLLHLVKIFSSLLKKDLVELTQIKVGATA